MEKYILTLYVSLEQELAIQELFIYRNWSFTKQQDYEVEPKTAALMTERSNSLDMSDLDWTEVTTIPSVGDQESDNNSDMMLLGPSGVSVKTNGTQELQDTSIVTNGNQELQDTSTDVDGQTSLAEQLLDTLRSATENAEVVRDKDNIVMQKSQENEISHTIVTRNSAVNKLNVKKTSARKRVTVASLIALEKKCTNVINSQKDNSSGQQNMCDLTKFKHFKTEETGNFEFDRGITEDSIVKKEDIQIYDERPRQKTKGRLGKYHCKECNYTFKLKGAFLNHKKDGQCLFECKFCGKKYTSRFYSNYKSHLKYHIKERPHRCLICDKTYIEEQTLKIHMRRHTGDRPYICDICGKRFYCSANLLGHKHNMHSESREMFQCDLCGAVLSNKGNLQAHKKLVHTLERMFTCEICGKGFKTQKRLEQVHAKVHMEVFPFKCDVTGCGKAFKRVEALTDHIRRHNNDRSHFCKVCDKGFYCSKDLRLHNRIHTGEKPFSCALCSYTCALAGNLTKHMKTHENSTL